MDTGSFRCVRSSFVPFTQRFATILANSEPSSPWELWNSHRDMFNVDIRNRFWRHLGLLRKDSIAIAHALLEVKNYLSENCQRSILNVWPTNKAWWSKSLCYRVAKIYIPPKPSQPGTHFNLSLQQEQLHVTNSIFGATLREFTPTNAVDILSPTPAAFHISQVLFITFPPSSFESHSFSLSCPPPFLIIF